ncbi:MAG: prepilin-type N-terminal cleavage/methylation domain-containing protein, partial [Holophagales bacterium]|nr:prepilin-type N-terminal cleavage/methylation domain-containing protein [Holophagales bacterium]
MKPLPYDIYGLVLDFPKVRLLIQSTAYTSDSSAKWSGVKRAGAPDTLRRAFQNNTAPAVRNGFSLIELLVVIVIVSILAIGGSMMIGSRRSGAVRSMLDELEGAVANAHQAAVATSRDTALVCKGVWEGNTGNPFRIAYGDAELTEADSGGPENFMKIVDGVLNGNPPNPNDSAKRIELSVAVAYNFAEHRDKTKKRPDDSIQMRARVVINGNDGWERAAGSKNENIL